MLLRTLHRPVLTALAALAIVAIAATGFVLFGSSDADSSAGPKPTIVLVHGAWADGSSWNEVSHQLQADGYDVRVPPNNLRGVRSDADHMRNYLSTIDGPIVLVGHSYGGMVITNAAVGNDQVRALVYVDALIPDDGDTLVGMTHPPSVFAQDPANVLDFVPFPDAPEGVVDTYVKTSIYGTAFANEGFSSDEVDVLAANQRPLSTQVFEEPSGTPAWATIPSWAIVGSADQIIPAADQSAMARRAGAEIVVVDAPHLSMVTEPRAVVDVIDRASAATVEQDR